MLAALAEEMREIDRKTIEEKGVPGIVLMEVAGLRVAEAARDLSGGEVTGKKVIILAGAGNNGGDGYVIARHLHNWSAQVKVLLLSTREKIKGDAKINLDIIDRILGNENIKEVSSQEDLFSWKEELKDADLIIDAILGTGTQGEVTGIKREAILLVNSLGKIVLSVDIPSGLDANTGKIQGCCIHARKTVSFAFPKVGMLVYPGVEYVGELQVVDIGIPQEVVREVSLDHYLLNSNLVQSWLPKRSRTAHKGSCGRVLVLAGSRGMGGAAVLCSQAALRSGAGLVTLGVPESVYPLLGPKLTEVIIKPLAETSEGTLALESWEQIEQLLPNVDVLVLGPGLSTNLETVSLVLQILEKANLPIVVDADGLNAVAMQKNILARKKTDLIFTPHPGEMARLSKTSIREIETNRLKLIQERAREWGVTLVLKGARTLVSSPRGEIYINSTGNPGMATAGSGDILAGTIGGLLAQGMEVSQGAGAGVYLHGLAGDLAVQVKGEMGLIAGDILSYLPWTMKMIKEGKGC